MIWKDSWYRKLKISLFLNNVLNFFHCPRLYVIMYKKGQYACEHSPCPSLTAKCTAHKCSSSVLCVYLILLLLFKEKFGLNCCRMVRWTFDAPSQLNWDFYFYLLFLFLYIFRSKPYVGVQEDDTFVNWIMFSVLWQYVELHLWRVHFLFFYSLLLCFCKYREVFLGFWICWYKASLPLVTVSAFFFAWTVCV